MGNDHLSPANAERIGRISMESSLAFEELQTLKHLIGTGKGSKSENLRILANSIEKRLANITRDSK
jgi:hypothetical protein